MKRGLKVKSGARAPVGGFEFKPSPGISAEGVKRISPLVDGAHAIPVGAQLDAPVCTTSPPCGHCWYCEQAKR